MKLRDFFQLVRIPTIFSSFSNAYAGYWIGGGGHGAKTLLLGLLAAGLYLMAGMALNDVADFKVDRMERPGRPLPSGAIPVSTAWMLSIGMLLLALICQWLANPIAAVVGVFLILAIFLYNFLLKGTFLGPMAMGMCRLLNLLCGIALCAEGTSDLLYLPASTYWVLISLGFYIACVTYLARDEVRGNATVRVRIFFTGLILWVCAWLGFSAIHFSLLMILLLAVLIRHLEFLWKPLSNLWKHPSSPPATGKSIGALLRSLPFTDVIAMLATGVAWPLALLGLLWMLPGPFLVKRFYST